MRKIIAILKAYKHYVLSPKGRYEYAHYGLLILILASIYILLRGVINLVW